MKIEMSIDEFLRMIDNLRIDTSEINIETPYKLNPPISEMRKLKVFTDTFNELSGPAKENVVHSDFVAALRKNGFELEDAHDMIRKAQQNGQIYERRHGVYAKA